MELTSVKRLGEIVESVEGLVARIQSLDSRNGQVRLPAAPSPLTLDATEEWLTIADECCRKPRIAESKRILKEKGVDVASIPADVLNEPDEIKRLIDTVDAMPLEFRSFAYRSLASALTKGIEDADAALVPYTSAATVVSKWSESGTEQQKVRDVALNEIAVAPLLVLTIVQVAKEACELLGIVSALGIVVPTFSSVQAANEGTKQFNRAYRAYSTFCAQEGVESAASLPRGLMLDAATLHFEAKRIELENEKRQLQSEIALLFAQLAAIGASGDEPASTIAEMRCAVEVLARKLAERRDELQQALGQGVYNVVDAVSRGTIPDRDAVGDDELGAAIRQAVECGYRLSLEAPNEN